MSFWSGPVSYHLALKPTASNTGFVGLNKVGCVCVLRAPILISKVALITRQNKAVHLEFARMISGDCLTKTYGWVKEVL